PTPDYNGPASFQYTIQDNGTTNGSSDPQTATATANFTVTPDNDAPVGQPETLTPIGEDSGANTILATALLANDSPGPLNEAGQTLAIVGVSSAVGGVVSLSGGNVIFTPAANFNGTASFVYTIRDNGVTGIVSDPQQVNVTATLPVFEVNDAPLAVNDSLASSGEDVIRTIPFAQLTTNDSRGPANESTQNLTVSAVGSAVGGSVAIVGSDVVFTPALNYSGAASFSYTLQDNGTTNGSAAPQTAVATVSFTLTPVNDAPTLNIAGSPTFTPIGQTQTTNAGNTVQALVASALPTDLITDIDPGALEGIAVVGVQDLAGQWQFSTNGGLTWTAFGAASTAQARLLQADANTRVRFLPDPGQISAQNVTITFRAWDRSSGSNGSVVDTSMNGDTTPFSTATDTATLVVNSVPTTTGVPNVSVPEDTASVPIDLFAAFADAETPDNQLTYSVVSNSQPSLFSGIAISSVTGLATFTVVPNLNGSSTVTIRATDVGGLSVQSTFTIQITEVNDAPTAVNNVLNNIAEDAPPVTISLLTLTANDVKGPANEANQTLQVISVANAIGGTAVISGASVIFTPTPNYNGPGSFTYTIADNGTTGGVLDTRTAIGSANFTIWPVNDAPVGTPETVAAVAEDGGAVPIPFATLLANDTTGPLDESGQSLTIASVTLVTGGTAVISGSNVLFTPALNFNGTATFLYTIRDNGTTNGASNPQQTSITATVPVYVVNDAPTGVNDTLASSLEDAPRVIPFASLLANDSRGPLNEASQNLTIVAVSGAVGGSVAIVGSDVVFTPASNFLGSASFTYTLRDDGTTNGLADPKTSTARATFTLTNSNDAPTLNPAGNPTFTTITETQATNGGDSVQTLVSRATPINLIQDIDAGALEGIAVTGVDNNHGDWQFSLDSGLTWSSFGPRSTSQATLLEANAATRIRFVPDASLPGSLNVSITYRAWDRTSGVNGETVDTTMNGGQTAFSTATEESLLRVNSSFAITGQTLTITGPGINDQLRVEFTDATHFTTTLGATAKSYDLATINNVVFNAGVGTDTTTFVGPTTVATNYVFSQNKLEVSLPGLTFTANASETNIGQGTNNDTGRFNDSTGNDVFTSVTGLAVMTGPLNSFSNQLTGVKRVNAFAVTGNDKVVIGDGPGVDNFYGNPAAPRYLNADRDVTVTGYDLVQVLSDAGEDIAQLGDTAGNDTFYGYSNQTLLRTGAGAQIHVIGFPKVYANATAGTDLAYFTDGAGDDIFYGLKPYSVLVGPGYLTEAIGFDRCFGIANGAGNDTALLYDSAGDDTFVAYGRVNTLSGVGFSNQSNFFESTYAYASTGNDLAQFYDSMGNERFVAGGNAATMFYPGYLVQARGFDRVTALSSLGGVDIRSVAAVDYALQTTGRWRNA
ncbi:MAG: tandem-95 repeat protein, partial [Planctomycetaceae bacterium]|nr:tandem-95 repeat protein [Planctomycetaceae bacterium]